MATKRGCRENAPSSFIQHRPKLEIIQVSISSRMDEQIVVYSYARNRSQQSKGPIC